MLKAAVMTAFSINRFREKLKKALENAEFDDLVLEMRKHCMMIEFDKWWRRKRSLR